MLKPGYKIQKILDTVDIEKHDIAKKTIPVNGGEAVILFIKQLTNTDNLSDLVIKPIIEYASTEQGKGLNTETAVNKVFYTADCKIDDDENKVLEYILSGMTIVLLSIDKKYAVVDLKKVEQRSVPTPEIEYSVRGPKDCFIENFDANLSLLRNRIKDPNLRIESFVVGRRTKSRVAMIYIEDVANEAAVSKIGKRISKIDIDGIYESGELQSFLLNKKSNLFPQMGIIERSDMAARLLLDGRVVTIIEGSGLAIYGPVTFIEFLYSCDDFYDNKFFGTFMRIIRYVCLFLAFTASSIFVAITSFHSEVLPSSYTIMLAEMRSAVPFSALLGALILEFLMEIIRESLLRVEKQIGAAIGIVGAIVIGQAATSAGIFSPILLIIASVSLLSSFVMPDPTIMNPFRILKIFLLIATGIFGFYGFTLVICVVLINLVSQNSFGVPYMAPLAPFNLRDYLKTYIGSKSLATYRTGFLNNKDKDIKEK